MRSRRAVRSRRLRVRARVVEQPRDAIELRVALFLQVVVGAIRAGAAPSTAAAPAAAADARKLERHADRRRDRALFPRVAVEIHHRSLAAEQAAAGRDDDGRQAVRARDRDGVAVVVERDLRAQLRVEVEDLVGVAEAAGARILEAHRRRALMKPGIDLRAGGVDDLRAGRDADVRADRSR